METSTDVHTEVTDLTSPTKIPSKATDLTSPAKSPSKARRHLAIKTTVMLMIIIIAYVIADMFFPEIVTLVAMLLPIIFAVVAPLVYKKDIEDAIKKPLGPAVRNTFYVLCAIIIIVGSPLIWNMVTTSPEVVDFLHFDDASLTVPAGNRRLEIDVQTFSGLRWGRYEIDFRLVPVPLVEGTAYLEHTERIILAHGLPFLGQRSISLPEFNFSNVGVYQLTISNNGRQIRDPITIWGTSR
ncbi:MAG: hypothetical protein FWC77_00280 [Defluviitaleaceae bacterium]|nr:hypothetical protein [Defluviitaleaceae bacterium]